MDSLSQGFDQGFGKRSLNGLDQGFGQGFGHAILDSWNKIQETYEPNRVTVNWTVSNQNRRNRMLQWNRWNRNQTELEPSEPDFGVFEDSYVCIFSRGIRWC